MLGGPEEKRNSITFRWEAGNPERQARIWALKGLCNLDKMKCAWKGFHAGRNSILEVIEACKCRDTWDSAGSLAGTSVSALWVVRSLEQWAEGGAAVP